MSKQMQPLELQTFDIEWELADSYFKQIVDTFGMPTVDLFASRTNKKCPIFYSRFPDPDATAVDAFTVSWRNKKFYAFPPFALISRMLRKIVLDQAEGVVVVPFWPTQLWYPLFKSLLVSNLLFFQPSKHLLLSSYRDRIHPLVSHLSLVAGELSSQRCQRKA